MLVKMTLVPGSTECSAVGLVVSLVSLATPKTPYSGFMPMSLPVDSSTHSHAMSSP